MGITYVKVRVQSMPSNGEFYEADFLVDTGAIDSVVPGNELERIGVRKRGSKKYELANGERIEFDFGLAELQLMDEVTSGRVVFGPDHAEPLLSVAALESAALRINPSTNSVEKMAASLLK